MMDWLILRRLPADNPAYSANVVAAETAKAAVELFTADFPDHMLTREFLAVPLHHAVMYMGRGKTEYKRTVTVEKMDVRIR